MQLVTRVARRKKPLGNRCILHDRDNVSCRIICRFNFKTTQKAAAIFVHLPLQIYVGTRSSGERSLRQMTIPPPPSPRSLHPLLLLLNGFLLSSTYIKISHLIHYASNSAAALINCNKTSLSFPVARNTQNIIRVYEM